ncbi:MAG TPA: lytic transglycosylase domain-containing protein, partial [Gemmatimonadales bacterium]
VTAFARATTTAPVAVDEVVVAEGASLEATRARLDRATEVLAYAGRYRISSELSAAIYDAALAEGIHPALAYQVVKVESRFRPSARSHRGAIGYTQIRLATARSYDPDLTEADLFDTETNLRLGFRFLREMLKRFDGNLHVALVAYNRGPTLVDSLLTQGEDPGNGYSELVLRGVSRRVAQQPVVQKAG